MPFVPSSRSPKKKRNSYSSLNTTDSNSSLNSSTDYFNNNDSNNDNNSKDEILDSISMINNNNNNNDNNPDSQSTLIPQYHQNESLNTINDYSKSNIPNNNNNDFKSPFRDNNNHFIIKPASSSPPSQNELNHINTVRKFSLDLSDYEDDIPLSISFLRKPSRSNSVESSRNEKQLMQQNTLLNSKNLSLMDNTIVPNFPTDQSYFPNNNDGDNQPYIPSPVYSNDTFGSNQSSIRRESLEYNNNSSSSNFHPLVRKKSGELVKSSLKLNSVFNSSKSLPTTPTYKQVHFGVNIDVKYFDEKDKPTAISATNSPVNSDNEDEDDDDDGNGLNYNDDDDDDDDEDEEYEQNHPNDIYYIAGDYLESENVFAYNRFKNLVSRWNLDLGALPKISYRDHIDQESPVFLERIFISVDKMVLIGQIATKNLSFEKKIKIIYTLNNWKNTETIDASYLPDIPRILKKSNYDRFSFKMSVVDLFAKYLEHNNNNSNDEFHNSKPIPLNVSFCIQYLTNGQEFWDNNCGLNYNFKFTNILPQDYLKTSGPPIKQSRHYLRRTRSHDDQLDSYKPENIDSSKNGNTTNSTTDTKLLPPPPQQQQQQQKSNSATTLNSLDKKQKDNMKNTINPNNYNDDDLSNYDTATTNKLLMTPSKNYDKMFESSSKNNSFIFNSKNFNFGSPGTPKLQIHNSDSFLTSPSFNDLNESSNFRVSTDPQKNDTFLNHNHKSGLNEDIQPLYLKSSSATSTPTKSKGINDSFISEKQKLLLNQHPDYIYPNYVNSSRTGILHPNDPLYRSSDIPSSIATTATTTEILSSPPLSSSPLILPTEDDVYPINDYRNNSISTNTNTNKSSTSSTESNSDNNIDSNGSQTSSSSLKRPDMNSKSYQNIIDQYCFFKSPSTVSTFLRNDINDNPTHGNTTFH